MLKKNNFISIKNFCEFGVNEKGVRRVYKSVGVNPRYCSLHLKNSVVFRLKKILENNLMGRNLKKRNYQLQSFSKELKGIYI